MIWTDVSFVQILHAVWHNIPSSSFESLALIALQLLLFPYRLFKPVWFLSMNAGSGKTHSRAETELCEHACCYKHPVLPQIFMLVRMSHLGRCNPQCFSVCCPRIVMFHGCLPCRISCILYRKHDFSLKNVSKSQTKQNSCGSSCECTNPGCALFPCHSSFYPAYLLSAYSLT